MEKWGPIKQHYQSKKEAWALKSAYFSKGELWGDRYGFTLADPFTRQELDAFQEATGIEMPSDLYEYLVYVSREIFVCLYPVVFSLYTEDIGSFKVKPEEDWVDADDFWDEDAEDYVDDGTFRVGDDGCAFRDVIVMRGDQKGSVWAAMDGSYMRRTTTFWDYVNAPL